MKRLNCSLSPDGYSMSDIKYKWAKAGAVGLAKELSLPQFKVLGHRQKEKVIDLTTGLYFASVFTFVAGFSSNQFKST